MNNCDEKPNKKHINNGALIVLVLYILLAIILGRNFFY